MNPDDGLRKRARDDGGDAKPIPPDADKRARFIGSKALDSVQKAATAEDMGPEQRIREAKKAMLAAKETLPPNWGSDKQQVTMYVKKLADVIAAAERIMRATDIETVGELARASFRPSDLLSMTKTHQWGAQLIRKVTEARLWDLTIGEEKNVLCP